jgi:hypothetical protein
MTDEARAQTDGDTSVPAGAEESRRPAWLRVVGLLASDIAIGALLGAMIIATLLFSSGASKFVYIDF